MRTLVGPLTLVLLTLSTGVAEATPPVVPIGWQFEDGDTENSTTIRIGVDNVSEKDVDAFDLTIKFFDAFRRPVRNRFFAQCQIWRRINRALRCNGTNTLQLHYDNGTVVGSGQVGEGYWEGTAFDSATRAQITITAVHFTNGTTWRGRSSTGILPEGEETNTRPEAPDEGSGVERACNECRARNGRCVHDAAGYRCVEASAAPAPAPCQRVVDGNCMDNGPTPAPPPSQPASPPLQTH